MLSIFILVVSTIALVYLLIQLVKAKQQGRFLHTLRDLLIILLAILMTAAIFYIGYRFFRAF
jgi:Co/Zn/Cd efflux system component